MPVSPLAAAYMMGGDNNAATMGMMDPAMMAAMPEIQLAQGMEQQGMSTAPAYPGQALARALQGGIGALMQKGAMSDLAKAYAGVPEEVANVLDQSQPGNPAAALMRDQNPLVRMLGWQMAQKTIPIQAEQKILRPNQTLVSGPTTVNTGSPALGAAAAGAERAATAPYTPAGSTVVGGVERPISEAELAANSGAQAPTRPRIPPAVTAQAAVPMPEAHATETPPANLVFATPPAAPKDQSQVPAGPPVPQFGKSPAYQAQVEGNTSAAKDFVEKDTPAFASTQSLLGRLDVIDHNINQLGPSWMGTGADTKAEAAKAWNSTLDSFGVKGMHIDPTKVATWEDFNKETIRGGMELIKSNFGGSREAASIIQMGKTAFPNVQGTYLGQKYVSATVRAAAQASSDLYNYKKQLFDQGKSLVGAEADFYKQHPPESYVMGAITSQIPGGAKQLLQSKGKNDIPLFDKQFGVGTGEFILGQQTQ